MTDLTVPGREDIVLALRALLAAVNKDQDAVEIALDEIRDPDSGNRFVAALLTVAATLAARRLKQPSEFVTLWLAAEIAVLDAERGEGLP